MLTILRKFIFYAALAFIVLSILGLTIAQVEPIEFAEADLKSVFYDTIIQGLPMAILFILFGTIHMKNKTAQNWAFVEFTMMAA